MSVTALIVVLIVVLAIIAIPVVVFLFRKNPPVLIALVVGILLFFIGLLRVSVEIDIGGGGEMILQRVISDPFLIIGVIGIVVGTILGYTLHKQDQGQKKEIEKKEQE